MKLYYAPGACSLSPHIVAVEAGIPVDLVKVDLKAHKTEDGGDYYKVNPKGSVPALMLDDGYLLTEGPVIVQYLADQKPESKLAPKAGTLERYKLMEWLTFINGEVHKTFSPLFGASSDDVKKDAKAKIAKKFEFVDGKLEGQQFLTGDTFTVADAYMFVMLTWAKKMHLDIPKNLSAFFDRVAKRDGVQEAMCQEGLIEKKAA
ncbi:MAG TPA: glutathione transferase GstA [Rhizomicrobium sp.]|jgi:glutathione S-transferase|nr:glutathione transferase GstA [Rhizomicrobium sp.]